MQQLVVDGLYVGDPDVLLLTNPTSRLVDDIAEVFEVASGKLGAHVSTSRHEIGASYKLHNQMVVIKTV